MTSCRNNSPPVNNRSTAIVCVTLESYIFDRTAGTSNTEHTVLVSILSTGRSQVHSISGSTDVETPLTLSVSISIIAIHFGLNNCLICRESHRSTISESYKTCFGTYNQSIVSRAVRIPHSMGGQDVILILHFEIIGNIILTDTAVIHPTLRHPDTYGQPRKNICVGNIIAFACKGDYRIIMGINVVFSFKSIRDFHPLKFPIVYIVQVDCGGYRIDICKIISNQIHKID